MGKGGKSIYKPIIGVVLGDAAGIGPELVAKAAAKGILTRYARPLVIADEKLLVLGKKIAGVDFPYRLVKTPDEVSDYSPLNQDHPDNNEILLLDTQSVDMDKLEFGKLSAINGKEQGDRLVDCVNYCKEGLLEGFCFAPLNKGAMKAGGYDFPSEHELFAEYFSLKTY